MIMVSPFGDKLNDKWETSIFILIHPPQRIPQLFIIHFDVCSGKGQNALTPPPAMAYNGNNLRKIEKGPV